MLESACSGQFDFHPENFADYTNYEPACLLKPHGSVLWSWTPPEIDAVDVLGGHLDEERLGNRSIDAGETLTKASRLIASERPINSFERLDGPTGGLSGIRYSAVLPALALPITGKDLLLWPPEQQQLFATALTTGCFGRVALVGWRGAEDHFTPMLDRLIGEGTKVLISTGASIEDEARQSANDVYTNLEFVLHRTRVKQHLDGSSNMIGSLEFDWLLE